MLARDAVAATALRADGRLTMRVDVRDGPAIVGDEGLLGQLVDTAVGVLVAASAAGAEVTVCAAPDESGWLISVTTSAADAATAERLLSTRLPHPDVHGEHRTGALAMLLARAVAGRHGGTLDMAMRRPGASIAVRLPISAERR
jgi:hypothetical protein